MVVLASSMRMFGRAKVSCRASTTAPGRPRGTRDGPRTVQLCRSVSMNEHTAASRSPRFYCTVEEKSVTMKKRFESPIKEWLAEPSQRSDTEVYEHEVQTLRAVAARARRGVHPPPRRDLASRRRSARRSSPKHRTNCGPSPNTTMAFERLCQPEVAGNASHVATIYKLLVSTLRWLGARAKTRLGRRPAASLWPACWQTPEAPHANRGEKS